jgi:hypothetical protein
LNAKYPDISTSADKLAERNHTFEEEMDATSYPGC